jgi:hypothetical protein
MIKLRAPKGKHWIASPQIEAATGVGLFLAGWMLLHDAYDTRGHEQPRWLRPFTWW